MDINDKIILERDVKTLQQQSASLADKVEKLERDQIIIIDAKVKLEKELTALSEKKSEVLKEISEEKSRWNIVQQAEKESLDRQDLDAKKILNRESYVATQEQQLKIKVEELNKQQSAISERERIIGEKEAKISEKEAKASNLVKQKEESLQKATTDFFVIKEKIINQINSWEV